MSANRRARRFAGLWRAVRRTFDALGRVHYEQAHMWDVWVQANRAAVSQAGPLTWVLTLDGYRLGGSYLPGG
jgi:hypothetical protein